MFTTTTQLLMRAQEPEHGRRSCRAMQRETAGRTSFFHGVILKYCGIIAVSFKHQNASLGYRLRLFYAVSFANLRADRFRLPSYAAITSCACHAKMFNTFLGCNFHYMLTLLQFLPRSKLQLNKTISSLLRIPLRTPAAEQRPRPKNCRKTWDVLKAKRRILMTVSRFEPLLEALLEMFLGPFWGLNEPKNGQGEPPLPEGSSRIENACGGSAAAPKSVSTAWERLEGLKAILDDGFTL